MDLQKVEQLESKITSELSQLNGKIETMQEEIVVYSDIEKLKRDAEERKQVRTISVFFCEGQSVKLNILSFSLQSFQETR